MTFEKTMVLVFVITVFQVAVIAEQSIQFGATAEEDKVCDAIRKQNEEEKKQQEYVKNLIDRIAAEIERSCDADLSSSEHHFEKYQDFPTGSALAVECFSFDARLFLAFTNGRGGHNGSFIYKMDTLTGTFSLFQTINPAAGRIKYFAIADKHYLAFAYRTIGDLVIYQWNGQQFVVSQSFPTNGTSNLHFFQVWPEIFLAVTSSNLEKSIIYKWEGNQFKTFQEIGTEIATGCTTFVINKETFIVFANFMKSRNSYSVQSPVYKWSVNSFVKVQSLQTNGAHDVKSFTHNGETFLAFANAYNGKSNDIDSFIYKWSGSRFAHFQSIPTRGATAVHPIEIYDETFLGVANERGVVYRFSGSQFIKYQEMINFKVNYMASFEYKGHFYLAVAYYRKDSTLYKWI